MNDEYPWFKQMMNKVGRDLVKSENRISVAFSGGLDCTGVVLSLMNAKARPLLIHMRHQRGITRWNELFQEDMVYALGDWLNLQVLFVPWDDHPVGVYNEGYAEFYGSLASLGVGRIVSGDGMDRCYFECYDDQKNHRACTLGEDIRVFHPFVELFACTIPNRLRLYQKSSYQERLQSDTVSETLQLVSPDLVLFSDHPLFLSLIHI